jgi:AcrR family transcriptional regulator
MKKRISLSVRERIDAALKLARRDNPRAKITVSELSRLAGVSRANLYTSHGDVVLQLQSESKANRQCRSNTDPSEKLKKIRLELENEVRKNRALVYLVIELRAELRRARDQLVRAKAVEAGQQP